MTIKNSPGRKSRDPQLPPLLQQAVADHQAGNLDDAAPLYRRFLAQNPDHPTALQLLGLLHSQLGEYDAAIDFMRESLRRFPQQAEVANNLGNALSLCGRLEEAGESYSEAVRLYPRYVDAWRNLGVCYLEQERYETAGTSFQRCLEIRPGDAASWLGLGNVFKQQGDFDQALQCYEKALALRPDYAEAHHNLGVCLRVKQRAVDAIKHFETARRLGLDRAELYQNLGSAQVDSLDIGGAIDAYRAAIQRNPEDIISHRNLNTLLWEQELLEDYLRSYREALLKRPDSEGLTMAYAVALNQQEAFEDAERALQQGLRHNPESSEIKSLLAYALEGQQRWEDALQTHADTVATPGSVANHQVSYARALLACRRPDEALPHAEEAIRQNPLNQRAIAYVGLCWRMLDDDRDAILNDYGKFIRVYDVPVPVRFANAEEFNMKLSAVLDSLHLGKRHPPEQTLRGGTQTHGDLFDRREAEIGELVAGLKLCIRDYIEQLPYDNAHPLLLRRSEHFNFAASWSVRLQRYGYHTMHVHPLGWISSAYYVRVPPEITDSETHGGGIKFGEPDIDLGRHGLARRLIQPVTGRLVLFPSYMWHGTVPCESDEPRMSVAFDVVPVHDNSNSDSSRHGEKV